MFIYGCILVKIMRLTWLGHSSVKIDTDKTIYIDPYAGEYSPADIVLVSRWHFDHCSLEKLKQASNDATFVLGTPEVAREVFPSSVLKVGEHRMFDGIEIVGMPVESNRLDQRGHVHDVGSGLGFAILAENKSVYFMGDSDFVPQFAGLRPDVLLIPVGGTYTHNAKEAARTASLINPKLAVPIHWGVTSGSGDDAELFKELCSVPVRVLQPGESVEV